MRMMFWVFIALGSASAVYAKEMNLHCIKIKSVDHMPNQPEEWFWDEYKKYDNPVTRLDPEASWYLNIQEVPSKTKSTPDLKITVKTGMNQSATLNVIQDFSKIDAWFAMSINTVPPIMYSYNNGGFSYAVSNGGTVRGISFDCTKY